MNYLHGVDAITGVKRNVARIADVLGVDQPSTAMVPAKSSLTQFLADMRAEAPHDIKDGAGTAIGAIGGAILWKNHRVLGALGGASLGRNLPSVLKPAERHLALCNLGVTSAGIFGSLSMPKHPVVGYVVGAVAAGVAIYAGKLR